MPEKERCLFVSIVAAVRACVRACVVLNAPNRSAIFGTRPVLFFWVYTGRTTRGADSNAIGGMAGALFQLIVTFFCILLWLSVLVLVVVVVGINLVWVVVWL